MTPIRIAFCITELDPGGAERCFVELIERLDRERFKPVVYCLGPRPIRNPTSLADRLETSGVVVHAFGARRAIQFPWIIGALVRRMKSDSPQIVQSFLFHANVLAPLAARRASVPHVLSGIRVAERRSGWHLRLSRWADRWVDRQVCVSESVRAFSATTGGLPSEKLVVIPNGVALEPFAANAPARLSDLGIAPGRRLITFIGRLDEQKGLDWLLRLLPHVFEGMPDCDLLVVGVGPQRAALAALSGQLGLADRVHFVGFRQDVPRILAASELLVLPSRWEGMPNVVLEAMAASKPVVATEVEGVAEALGPAGAQQIVRRDHGEAFAAKVRAILQNPALAGELGQANRARAEQSFGIDAMVETYQRLYLSLNSAGA
jgi:glycosyltransferase involved in cell wall biosynthesis